MAQGAVTLSDIPPPTTLRMKIFSITHELQLSADDKGESCV